MSLVACQMVKAHACLSEWGDTRLAKRVGQLFAAVAMCLSKILEAGACHGFTPRVEEHLRYASRPPDRKPPAQRRDRFPSTRAGSVLGGLSHG